MSHLPTSARYWSSSTSHGSKQRIGTRWGWSVTHFACWLEALVPLSYAIEARCLSPGGATTRRATLCCPS